MTNEIEFPQFYQGLYQRVEGRYRPLLVDAMREIRALQINDDLAPYLAFQTWENPQPSFILLPLMYLATAETAGGITESHVRYLPTIMLMAEFCAVADDTIDRTPKRSSRSTFAARYGDASAVPMGFALSSLVLDRSRDDPRLFDCALRFIMRFAGLELWERTNLYPKRALYGEWLEHRYLQAHIATGYALDSALVMSTGERWPDGSVATFARIGQDVDDIVNIVEYRDLDGENDDLQCGIVTRPLVLAIRAVPSLAGDVEELWSHYRPLHDLQLSLLDLHARRSETARATSDLYAHVRRTIIEQGVPLAVRECLSEFKASVRETPPLLRPLMRDLTSAFLDRLRRCDYAELEEEPRIGVLSEAG